MTIVSGARLTRGHNRTRSTAGSCNNVKAVKASYAVSVQVKLGQDDYWCILSILRDNLNEDTQDLYISKRVTAPPPGNTLDH